MSKKKVAVIILNYNGWKDTLECLKALQKSQISNLKSQIILIDNGSTDNSVKNINPTIQNADNLGFSGGNNVGIKYALKEKNDYVLLLNNDTLVDKNFISALVKTAESDKNIGIVGPKIYFAKGYEYHEKRYKKSELGKVFWYAGGIIDWKNIYASHRGVDDVDSGQYDQRESTDFISGCCMLIKREVLEKIGYLDDQLYLYLEDLDFCLRAKQAGYKLIYEPKSIIWHKNASSSDKPGSKLHQYYQTRNRMIVGMRYAPLRTRLALLRESLKILHEGGIRKKAILDYYLYKWGEADT